MTPLEFRSVRDRLRMTQAEAAKLGGVKPLFISIFERGYCARPRRKNRLGLERAYGSMLSQLPDADKNLTDWSKLHGEPKYGHGLRASHAEPPAYKGHDRAWLERQVLTALRGNSLGIVERDHEALFVVRGGDVVDICRMVIEATGGKLG